ncbi:phage terminase small subunit [Novosphingobium rosa]|uniref:phage terminase small subunit n=1 Tax=Novosphingobium rosa TaxID=76978 RepID=UPI0009FBAC31|nr:phage terminase small subunit [Novosphingobium rosa]
MTSPARRHMQQALARQAAAPTARPGPSEIAEDSDAGREYRLLLVAMGEDLRQLQSIQSITRKVEVKTAMMGQYADWLEGAQQRPEAVQDDIVFHCMVWAMDIGDWEQAFDLANLVLLHEMASPVQFNRTPAAIIAELPANNALGPKPTISLDWLKAFRDLTADQDMHDQIRAKVQKAIGLALKAQADAFDPDAESAPAGGKAALIAAATEELTKALHLDQHCGVKVTLAQLSRAAVALKEEKTQCATPSKPSAAPSQARPTPSRKPSKTPSTRSKS